MKKILGVIGSPRKKGNTHVLVSQILSGAENQGFMQDIVFLNDLHIEECIGCQVCWKTGSCVKQDDMIVLYQKIQESQVAFQYHQYRQAYRDIVKKVMTQ